MSFRTNENQQMSMDDPLYNLTEREARILKGSWAEGFANHIFPNLREEPFSALYSANDASKPNSPANVILGLLLLKEQFGLTDEDAMEQLLFNIQFQYALHTSSFHEQPVNDNTLRRFRNRVYEYERETGKDLIREAFKALAERLSGIMGLDPSLKRVDSLMISSGCKRLSRLDIMHETLRLAARQARKSGKETPLSKKYADGDGNRDIGYRLKGGDVAAKMEELLRDAADLLGEHGGRLGQSEAFAALRRMLDDQSEADGGARVPKSGKEIGPESMQTPHEQDATYRKKAGKGHVGFVGNIVEACDGGSNLITDYDMQKNTYSDAQFAQDMLGALPDGGGDAGTAVFDGAYVSADLLGMAEAKGVKVVTASLIGGLQGTFEAEFEIDGCGRIVKCPAGHSPIDSKRGNGCYKAHFDADTCESCEHCGRCPGVFQKKHALIKFGDAALRRAAYERQLGSEEYRKLIKKRNGIEGINSVLRRTYGIDHMREKGLVRKRQRFGLKLMAVNAKRLYKWLKDKGNHTPVFPPAFAPRLSRLFFARICSASISISAQFVYV
jgi:ferredoxin